MKELVLVRHAKSSWQQAELADHQRPLNERGRRSAPEMGERLRAAGFAPDRIVASTARRALDTAELMAEALNFDPADIEPEATLYAASPALWLQLIRSLPAQCSRVMMVGHNPEITALCNQLAPAALDNVPTCGLLYLRYDSDDWGQVPKSAPDDWHFDFPKSRAVGDWLTA